LFKRLSEQSEGEMTFYKNLEGSLSREDQVCMPPPETSTVLGFIKEQLYLDFPKNKHGSKFRNYLV
jgi:hypothetical protein